MLAELISFAFCSTTSFTHVALAIHHRASYTRTLSLVPIFLFHFSLHFSSWSRHVIWFLSQQVNVTSLAWMSKKEVSSVSDPAIRGFPCPRQSSRVWRASGDFISSQFFLQDDNCLLAINSKEQHQQQQQQQQHRRHHHHQKQIKKVYRSKATNQLQRHTNSVDHLSSLHHHPNNTDVDTTNTTRINERTSMVSIVQPFSRLVSK